MTLDQQKKYYVDQKVFFKEYSGRVSALWESKDTEPSFGVKVKCKFKDKVNGGIADKVYLVTDERFLKVVA